ncbi:thioredoxin domain-containing protein [Conexibacter sp. JD483]|uniref:thioredoxin domain-containing protein n=1 Tax=unclassified Conexibacter TaxID=2627773 RepID=UPI0027237E05|nr:MULTISPECIES: thioredoxin domain-containing protein [unclassified Conexibacter]MDO8187119.1 thioredoxin domain-containing protein [Conexibacter sp. CPCC 205706]MDO8200295.1 thioredoxin domain-containing protein [Conexibacter sp. CPCC 205762]MDR9368909.1 thioredoxin domain-containing protein [Conexibacter sp. JD483]
MANALAHETSPYLLQHKDNPVDWRPWGPAALAEARERDVPLLISIGYSACHWCHVMERESFEDPEIAELMNELFVCVKVDREERPDVDALYMDAVQAMTGHGGWPLNAFATPDQVPFYAGTYFPPEPRQGLPAWRQVLEAIGDAWQTRREEIVAQSAPLVERLEGAGRLAPSGAMVDPGLVDDAVDHLRQSSDAVHGGFGSAPKFPQSSAIELLLTAGETTIALDALRAMARGGIHDQLGGGFSRYAVDARWIVPHFEKMLYDNALLARAYLHAWQLTGEPTLRAVVEDTLDFLLRELRGPEGAFYSALDADSEGEEGRFYVWSLGELRAALGDEALLEVAVRWYGASERGNFEGVNILVRAEGATAPEPPELPEIRRRLLAVRDRRVRPGLDDKRLTSWNALAIAALAEAGAVLERDDWLAAALTAAAFLLDGLQDADGRLKRSWKDGRATLAGYLEDHAYLTDALLTLYEATLEPRWFAAARRLADVTIARFGDDEQGGFFQTADDHEQLVARRKELEDTPIPSGQSAIALALLRLSRLTGEPEYERRAEGVIALLHPMAASHPQAFPHLLRAIAFQQAEVHEVAVVGPAAGAAPLLRVVRERFRPHVVVAGALDGASDADAPGPELLEARTAVDGEAAAYVCERFTCRRPVTDPTALAELLD